MKSLCIHIHSFGLVKELDLCIKRHLFFSNWLKLGSQKLWVGQKATEKSGPISSCTLLSVIGWLLLLRVPDSIYMFALCHRAHIGHTEQILHFLVCPFFVYIVSQRSIFLVPMVLCFLILEVTAAVVCEGTGEGIFFYRFWMKSGLAKKIHLWPVISTLLQRSHLLSTDTLGTEYELNPPKTSEKSLKSSQS